MSYVPPHLRNKQQSNDTNMPPTPFKKERRQPRRTHEKAPWELQKEQAERDAEEKRKIAQRALENTEENFPVLGNAITATSSTWNTSGRKFSELAADWEVDDDARKKREDHEKEFGRKGIAAVISLPMFRPIKRFSEVEDESPKEDEVEKPVDEDAGWTVVDNTKYRKPKPKREHDSEDESTNEPKDEDDTVWAGPEEHETCWDDRRY